MKSILYLQGQVTHIEPHTDGMVLQVVHQNPKGDDNTCVQVQIGGDLLRVLDRQGLQLGCTMSFKGNLLSTHPLTVRAVSAWVLEGTSANEGVVRLQGRATEGSHFELSLSGGRATVQVVGEGQDWKLKRKDIELTGQVVSGGQGLTVKVIKARGA